MEWRLFSVASFIILSLLATSVLAADKQIQAKVGDVMDVGGGTMRIDFQPQEKLPPVEQADVLFGGKPVGKIIGIYADGDSLAALFKPNGGFEIQEGMGIVLVCHEAEKTGPLKLPVKVVQSNKQTIFEIQAGKDKGIKIGQHFSVVICKDLPALDFVTVQVAAKVSRLELRGVIDSSDNQGLAIRFKAVRDAIERGGKMPVGCELPFIATATDRQDIEIGVAQGIQSKSSADSDQTSTTQPQSEDSNQPSVQETFNVCGSIFWRRNDGTAFPLADLPVNLMAFQTSVMEPDSYPYNEDQVTDGSGHFCFEGVPYKYLTEGFAYQLNASYTFSTVDENGNSVSQTATWRLNVAAQPGETVSVSLDDTNNQ